MTTLIIGLLAGFFFSLAMYASDKPDTADMVMMLLFGAVFIGLGIWEAKKERKEKLRLQNIVDMATIELDAEYEEIMRTSKTAEELERIEPLAEKDPRRWGHVNRQVIEMFTKAYLDRTDPLAWKRLVEMYIRQMKKDPSIIDERMDEMLELLAQRDKGDKNRD